LDFLCERIVHCCIEDGTGDELLSSGKQDDDDDDDDHNDEAVV